MLSENSDMALRAPMPSFEEISERLNDRLNTDPHNKGNTQASVLKDRVIPRTLPDILIDLDRDYTGEDRLTPHALSEQLFGLDWGDIGDAFVIPDRLSNILLDTEWENIGVSLVIEYFFDILKLCKDILSEYFPETVLSAFTDKLVSIETLIDGAMYIWINFKDVWMFAIQKVLEFVEEELKHPEQQPQEGAVSTGEPVTAERHHGYNLRPRYQ